VIYLDYHATTPVDRRVADRIYHFMVSEFGNASSLDHEWGDRAESAIQQAARQVANLVGSKFNCSVLLDTLHSESTEASLEAQNQKLVELRHEIRVGSAKESGKHWQA
jgi:cysteine sulfinate desulfinase/cysteine desulfurase-like protein